MPDLMQRDDGLYVVLKKRWLRRQDAYMVMSKNLTTGEKQKEVLPTAVFRERKQFSAHTSTS